MQKIKKSYWFDKDAQVINNPSSDFEDGKEVGKYDQIDWAEKHQ